MIARALSRSPHVAERAEIARPSDIRSDSPALEIAPSPAISTAPATEQAECAGFGLNIDPADQTLIVPSRDDALTAAAIVGTRAEPRALARFELLEAFDLFYAESGLDQKKAAAQFATMIGAGFSQGLSPETLEYLAGRLPAGPTILRWRRKAARGLAALATGQRGRTSELNRKPESAAWLLGQLLRPRGKFISSVTLAKALNAAKQSDFSQRQVLRFRRRIEIANRADLTAALNPDAFRSRFAVRLGDSNEEFSECAQTNPFQVALIDGTPSNVLTESGRAHVTILQFPVNRLAVAVVWSGEGGLPICRLMAKAAEKCGVSDLALTDNGPGERGRRTALFARAIGTTLKFAQKFTPEQKADVESMVRNLCQILFPQLPGFAGANVQQRQELRNYFAMSDRRGRDDRDLLGVKLTNAELELEIDRYLTRVYPYSPHAGLGGMTPAAKLQEQIAAGLVARKISGDRQSALAVLYLCEGVRRKVTGEGIAFDGVQHWTHALVPWIDKWVLVNRCANPEELLVYSESEPRRFIGIAESTAHLHGESRQALAIEAKIIQKRRKKRVRAAARQLRRDSDEDIFSLIVNASPAGLPEIPSVEVTTPSIQAGVEAAAALAERAASPRPLRDSDPDEDAKYARLGEAADRQMAKLNNGAL